jgi:hypothetical protein
MSEDERAPQVLRSQHQTTGVRNFTARSRQRRALCGSCTWRLLVAARGFQGRSHQNAGPSWSNIFNGKVLKNQATQQLPSCWLREWWRRHAQGMPCHANAEHVPRLAQSHNRIARRLRDTSIFIFFFLNFFSSFCFLLWLGTQAIVFVVIDVCSMETLGSRTHPLFSSPPVRKSTLARLRTPSLLLTKSQISVSTLGK